MTRRKSDIVLFALAALAGAVLAWLSLLRHSRFASAQDLAMFDQILWSIRQGCGPWTSMSGNSWLQFPHNFFGEHVSPILYLLAYPAALTPGPEFLLVLQALAFALAAIPAARIVMAETGRYQAGFLAGLAWLAFPANWGAVLFDFHMECLGALFIFAFWLSFRRASPACWIWALLYMACKEDAPVYLAALALAGGFVSGQRRLGTGIFLAALAYGIAAWFVIQPAFSPEGKALLGQRIALPPGLEAVVPWIQEQFFSWSRWRAIGGHLMAFGWLPLFSGPAMLPWLAALGAMWVSNDFEQAHGMLHYPLTFYPLLFISAAIGMRNIGRWMQGSHITLQRIWLAAAAGSCLAGIGLGWIPGMEAVKGVYGPGNAAALRAAPALLAAIPAGDSVRAPRTLVPHLSRRGDLRVLMAPAADTDWIVTRLDGIVYPCPDHDRWLASELLSGRSEYGVYAAAGRLLVVFKRGWSRDLNGAVLRQIECAVEAEHIYHKTGRAVWDGEALNGVAFMFAPSDPDGFALFGGYRSLPAGTYRVQFRIRTRAIRPSAMACLEVSQDSGRNIRASRAIAEFLPGYTNVTLEADLDRESPVEFRIRKIAPGYLWADQVTWERRGGTVDAGGARP